MMGLRVSEVGGRVRFSVRVQPRASRSKVMGLYGDAMKIRLTAPPVDGAANEQLVEFLAGVFAVGTREVKILAGHGSRSKLIEIAGITERAVHTVLIGNAE